jgi:hypothetical protein
MRQAAFLTSLDVRQISEDDWELLAPLHYYSPLLSREIIIPAGFITDFASVPRLPFIYWFTGGKAHAPAAIHDWFYRTNTEDITRATADALLAEAMEARGYWKIRTWSMWAGVRIGGYWSYDTRSTQGVSHADQLVSYP